MRLILKFRNFLFLFLISSCQNKKNNVLVIETSKLDLIGNYYFDTIVYSPKKENQNYQLSSRRTIELELFEDSSFDEINTTYQTFDAMDYFGKWSISEDKIILTVEGQLVYQGNEFVRSTQSEQKKQFKKIESPRYFPKS